MERKSTENVADLLKELIGSNTLVVQELAAIRKGMGAPESVVAGSVQFVTNCVPSGSCESAGQEVINAVIAGPAFQNVPGIYTCVFTNPAKKVLSSHATAKDAGAQGFAIVSCAVPVHGPDFVTGKQWTSTVAITQNGDTLK